MTGDSDGYEDSSSRVLSNEELIGRYGRPRGYRLVFSNGVFDLLHSGHVTSLEAARGCGDRLVVAVNSDQSTNRLKGPGRPVQTAEDRARILAALRCVDAVTIFEDDTPAALIERLLPDVLVKGADYRIEEIAGARAVLEAGGEVRLIDLEQGRSTSDLIGRVRGAALREPGTNE